MEDNTQPINAPVQSPQQLPVEPAKTEKSRLLLVSLIILEIVTVLIAVYFAYQFTQLKKQLITQSSPTPVSNSVLPTTSPVVSGLISPIPDGTSNWKTYNNTTYKYTLKYPLGWEIRAEGGADITTFPAPVLNSPCNYDAGQLCSQIFVETGTYDPEKKFEPNFIIDLTSSKPDKVTNKTMTTVDGEEAQGFGYFQSNYGDKGRLLYVLVTNHKNIKYTFTYEESQKGHIFQTGNDWQNKKVFDQIISTFKFTQ